MFRSLQLLGIGTVYTYSPNRGSGRSGLRRSGRLRWPSVDSSLYRRVGEVRIKTAYLNQSSFLGKVQYKGCRMWLCYTLRRHFGPNDGYYQDHLDPFALLSVPDKQLTQHKVKLKNTSKRLSLFLFYVLCPTASLCLSFTLSRLLFSPFSNVSSVTFSFNKTRDANTRGVTSLR